MDLNALTCSVYFEIFSFGNDAISRLNMRAGKPHWTYISF